MTYEEIDEKGLDDASPAEIEASKIISKITRYGGFDMAWDTTSYREDIFRGVVDSLEKWRKR